MILRTLVVALLATLTLVASATPASNRLAMEVVAKGLRQPVHVAVAPGEPGRLYVVERAGSVRIVENGRVQPEPFLDIRPRVRSTGLLGLFSIAFHPRYPTDRRAYVMYSGGAGNVYVAELDVRDGRARVTRIVLRVQVSKSAYAHVGGQLAFGRGGLLNVGLGDGLSPEAAQDRTSPLGKILRLDPDRPAPTPSLVAMGLRNPWRFSFDRQTGDLFIADVGEASWEEIDVVRQETRGALNFGWGADVAAPTVDVEPPYLRYPHPAGECAAVIGGFVYRGRALPTQRGRYFYGDSCSGAVWSVRADVTRPRPRREPITVGQLASFGEDAAGELYLVARGRGAVLRLTSTAP